MKLPQSYACRRCGRTRSTREYERSRFCRNCGTFLMPAAKAIHYLKDRPSTQAPARIVLPEDYEFREGQVDFAKEAAEALASSEVFIASAPCGIGKPLASLVAILPQLRDSKLVICFRVPTRHLTRETPT